MTAVDDQRPDQAAIEAGGAIMERLFMAMLGSLELATVHLGSQLGLYAALAEPRTADELAAAAASTPATPGSGWSSRRSADWSTSPPRATSGPVAT